MGFKTLRRKRRRWLALAVLACAAAALAQETPEADAVLLRVRDRMLPELEHLPRYTCVQTITRRLYVPESQAPGSSCAELIAAQQNRTHELPLMKWDRLRLEV